MHVFLVNGIPRSNLKRTSLLLKRSNCGAVENFVDQSHLVRSGPGNIVDPPETLTNTHNSINSDFGFEVTYRATDHGATSQAVSLELLASQVQTRVWHDRPSTVECATTSYTPDELEVLNTERIAIPDSCSQGLLNTLTHALESSGVDLSQTSISVELDIAKHSDSGMPSMAFCPKDNRNLPPNNEALLHYIIGSSSNDSIQAHKRAELNTASNGILLILFYTWFQSLLFPKTKFKSGDPRKAYAIRRPQPLLKFALTSGSYCDPMVRMYTPKKLFQELEMAKEKYIQTTCKIQSERKIALPKIVDSYAKDLGLCSASLFKMIEHSASYYMLQKSFHHPHQENKISKNLDNSKQVYSAPNL